MADAVLSQVPCGSEHPTSTVILYSINGCAGLTTFTISVLTVIRLAATADDRSTQRSSWQFRVLHYVQLMFSILCAVYGLLHPLSNILFCNPSIVALSNQTATIFFWCLPMVRLSAHKQIENSSFLFLDVLFVAIQIEQNGLRCNAFDAVDTSDITDDI